MTLEHLDVVLTFVVILTGVSLIITTLTQMISALVGLRGSNLRWGIATLLGELDPQLKNHTMEIAEKVLHHPLISDSALSHYDTALVHRWKLASAIRCEELIKILRLLARPPAADDAAAGAASAAAIEPWRKALRDSLDRVQPEASDALLSLAPQVRQVFADNPAKAEALVESLMSKTEHLASEVSDWFDPMMDRVSQRFTLHTRVWTVLFSIVLAFALQLDAFKLLTSLSSDSELRARILASADAITRKAEETLPSASSAPARAHTAALQRLIAGHPDELKGLPAPPPLSSQDAAESWLREQLQAAGITDSDTWIRRYETLMPLASLQVSTGDLGQLVRDKLTLQLWPDPYPQPFYRDWTPRSRGLWGMLATAALLSLGAPFWFHLLKNLSNLRSAVAAKESNEAAQRAAANTDTGDGD